MVLPCVVPWQRGWERFEVIRLRCCSTAKRLMVRSNFVELRKWDIKSKVEIHNLFSDWLNSINKLTNLRAHAKNGPVLRLRTSTIKLNLLLLHTTFMKAGAFLYDTTWHTQNVKSLAQTLPRYNTRSRLLSNQSV